MKRYITLLILVCSFTVRALSISPSLVYLDSPLGWKYLSESTSSSHFGNLIRYYQSQINLAYCGIASSVIMLNALHVPAPVDSWHYPYANFNQRSIFTPTLLKQGITPHKISSRGMTLATLNRILTSYHLKTNVYYASSLTYKQFTNLLSKVMTTQKDYVVVNFYRPTLKQVGGGHISPLAAFDPTRHRVLILDVAGYKYPAVWVGERSLYQAMLAHDSASKRSRGFIVLHR